MCYTVCHRDPLIAPTLSSPDSAAQDASSFFSTSLPLSCVSQGGHLHAFIAAICLSLALSSSSRINLVDGTTTTAKNLKGSQPFSSLIKAMHFTIEELRSRGGKNIKLQTIYHPIPQVLLSLVVFLSSQFFMCPFLPYCDIYYIIYIMYHRIISHTIVNLYHNKMWNTQ